MVEKENHRVGRQGGEGRTAIRILLTLRLVRVPVFGDASLHEKLAACFGPKQLCAMQFLPVVLEIHFAAAASVTEGGRGRRDFAVAAAWVAATNGSLCYQHVASWLRNTSYPLSQSQLDIFLSLCSPLKLYFVMQKGQRRQRLPRLQLQLPYR